jgi:hypothetical protein
MLEYPYMWARQLYVGQTTQPIAKRLNNHKNPSKGAPSLWCQFGLNELVIDIWAVKVEDKDIKTMEDDPSMKRANSDREKQDIVLETVEGEVAFLIRQDHGQWPKYQIEIHFHQSQDEHRNIAREIVNHYRSPSCPTD